MIESRGFTKEESEALKNLYKERSTIMLEVPKDSIEGRILCLIGKQTAKGRAKYGHTLDGCPDEKYDWRLMAMEEMIDCMQYQQKEIIRLERLLNP